MTEKVIDLFKEADFKDNIMEFEESKKVKECIANLEVNHIVLCVYSKSFFEEGANYILQPQVLNPIMKNLLLKETT